MALDLQDQQELENFKYWWSKWGRWLALAFAVVAVSYLAHVVWKERRERRDGEAMVLRADYFAAIDSEAQRLKVLRHLQNDYADTLPAMTTTLYEAYLQHFGNGDPGVVAGHLRWVAENTGASDLTHQLAIMSLCKELMNSGNFEDVLKLLNDNVLKRSIPLYVPLERELRAQAMLLLGRFDDSLAEYDRALEDVKNLRDKHKTAEGQVVDIAGYDMFEEFLKSSRNMVAGLKSDEEAARSFLAGFDDLREIKKRADEAMAAAQTNADAKDEAAEKTGDGTEAPAVDGEAAAVPEQDGDSGKAAEADAEAAQESAPFEGLKPADEDVEEKAREIGEAAESAPEEARDALKEVEEEVGKAIEAADEGVREATGEEASVASDEAR